MARSVCVDVSNNHLAGQMMTDGDIDLIIKNWIIGQCNSRVFIGLAIMVYEPLYHAPRTRDVFEAFLFFFLSLVCSIFGGVFNKTIIPLALVGYEMVIANSALCVSLAIYHFISNARLWNNC